jgi:glycosyltransferase involved in cell wall biosynthesis
MNKKILIICEARPPQVNGVVTTFTNLKIELEKIGYEVDIIGPDNPIFKTMELPIYPEIRIVLNPWKVKYFLHSQYNYIHIATEGPLGYYASRYCKKNGIKFSSSYHTKMPEYINNKFKIIPTSLVYKYMRSLHEASTNILVTSDSMRDELKERSFNNKMITWTRGVDNTIFNPFDKTIMDKPYILYVGRISSEKNIEEFLNLRCEGYYKVVVGDGPDHAKLLKKYWFNRDIKFLGKQTGKKLARIYAGASCFVFPSKTDTFGIVNIEALCCGTPVAAYNVTGPRDIVIDGVNGFLRDNLQYAVDLCLLADKELFNRVEIAKVAQEKYSWYNCAQIFVEGLVQNVKSNSRDSQQTQTL